MNANIKKMLKGEMIKLGLHYGFLL